MAMKKLRARMLWHKTEPGAQAREWSARKLLSYVNLMCHFFPSSGLFSPSGAPNKVNLPHGTRDVEPICPTHRHGEPAIIYPLALIMQIVFLALASS